MAGWRTPCNWKKENNGTVDEGNRKGGGKAKNQSCKPCEVICKDCSASWRVN